MALRTAARAARSSLWTIRTTQWCGQHSAVWRPGRAAGRHLATSQRREPPTPPPPELCCMSGCRNCVWTQYMDELEEYGKLELAEKTKPKVPNQAAAQVDTGIDEFLKLEMRLRSKKNAENTSDALP
eukprot:m.63147 g.63147  ORF g.63147 m.63147 type:complete len:127 (+) comp7440_c0_seq1:1471-1851(+)